MNTTFFAARYFVTRLYFRYAFRSIFFIRFSTSCCWPPDWIGWPLHEFHCFSMPILTMDAAISHWCQMDGQATPHYATAGWLSFSRRLAAADYYAMPMLPQHAPPCSVFEAMPLITYASDYFIRHSQPATARQPFSPEGRASHNIYWLLVFIADYVEAEFSMFSHFHGITNSYWRFRQ